MISFFFSSRRRHTRLVRDWSSDVCSSDLKLSNKQFMSKAPEKVVAREKEKQEDMTAELVKVNENLEILQ